MMVDGPDCGRSDAFARIWSAPTPDSWVSVWPQKLPPLKPSRAVAAIRNGTRYRPVFLSTPAFGAQIRSQPQSIGNLTSVPHSTGGTAPRAISDNRSHRTVSHDEARCVSTVPDVRDDRTSTLRDHHGLHPVPQVWVDVNDNSIFRVRLTDHSAPSWSITFV